jgi:predicted tellurium resistance membrane protein TerC
VELFSTEAILSLFTLTILEIVLGIDNIIFISILAGKLPEKLRDKARKIGLLGALATRLLLLSLIAFIVQLTTPLFSVLGFDFSGKAIILLVGGLFLIYKATHEIHDKLEGEDEAVVLKRGSGATMSSVIIQIMLLDMVFSIDSVITAVGMSRHLEIMIAANVIALGVMLVASKWISDFVQKHPTVKVLALSFLLMIGLVLVADGFSFHIPKGYVYFAMGFSVFVEAINIKVVGNKKSKRARSPQALT